jgi:beta-RFAP synthase
MVIKVKTPARLHLGQIDLNGSLHRMFGGMGVAIDQPNVELEVYPDCQLTVKGKNTGQVKRLAQQFFLYFGLQPGAEIRVKQTIPEHVGLGSGTQLALAVGSALARLYRLTVEVEELARIMDRGGSRSSIGIGAFKHGGFLVDGGRKIFVEGPEHGQADYIPPITIRHDFPEDWHFVVAIPDRPPGLHGPAEVEAFRRLPPMADEKVGAICRYLIMKMVPALVEKDLDDFGQALTSIQRLVGEHFSPVQKGTISNSLSARVIEFMLANGAKSAGQSSWGPAVYGLVRQDFVSQLKDQVEKFLENRGTVFAARVLNHGAELESKELETLTCWGMKE